MSEETRPEPNIEKPVSPGDVLREARQKYGLSEEDVAAELNLSVYQIQALEDDRFQELPGETYTRGYIKAYARLLNADENGILKDFVFQENTTITGIQPVIRETRSSDRHMKLLSLGVFVLLGGLMFMWWQGRDESNVVPLKAVDVAEKAETEEEPANGSAAPGVPAEGGATGSQQTEFVTREQMMSGDAIERTVVQTSVVPVVSSVNETADTGEDENPTQSDVEALRQTSVQGVELSQNVSGNETEPAEQQIAVTATDGGASAVDNNAAQTTETNPVALIAAGTDNQVATSTSSVKKQQQTALLLSDDSTQEVKLKFSATSWVDLRDAGGQRLLYKNVDQGQQVSVKGQPPFSIFLGNAEGVEIEYLGKPFDFTAYTNGIYARFELGN